MFESTITLMLIISAFIAISLFALVVYMSKGTYFEDPQKSFEYPLFDSVDDLNDAIKKEKKKK